MKKRSTALLALLAALLAGCGGSTDPREPAWIVPKQEASWNWQLQGVPDLSLEVEVWDLDLFDTPTSTIEALHDRGALVMCYFSAGSYEAWRPDAGEFPPEALGEELSGWDEQWLDIRHPSVRSIMLKRMDLAREKGCDGLEPDNVDAYANESGFDLTDSDQIDYNLFLAKEAHQRGLFVALKNDLDQVGELEPFFDLALNEQCHEYEECELLTPFVDAGKAVFNAEYASRYVSNEGEARDQLCEEARRERFRTLVLPVALDGSFRYTCD